MSDPAGLLGVEAPSCPFLGLPDDPVTRFSFPSEAHRCRATDRPRPIELGHQATFCLGGTYPECPRYRAAAGQRPADTGSPASRPTDAAAIPADALPMATGVQTPVAPSILPIAPGVPLARVGLSQVAAPAREPDATRPSMGRWRRAMAVVVAVVVVAASAFLGGPILADWLMGAGVGAAPPSAAASITPPISPAPSRLTPAARATSSLSPAPVSSPTPASSPKPERTATSRIHVVVKGETLIGIAATYGVTVAALEKTNAITNTGLIYVGERLVIPAP